MKNNLLSNEKLNDYKLSQLMEGAVRDVFKGMLPGESLSANIGEDDAVKLLANKRTEGLMASMVEFSGSTKGSLTVWVDKAGAIYYGSKVFGMKPLDIKNEGEGLLQDGLGEIANMIAGNFKNRILEVGINCQIMAPKTLDNAEKENQIKKEKMSFRRIIKCEDQEYPIFIDLTIN